MPFVLLTFLLGTAVFLFAPDCAAQPVQVQPRQHILPAAYGALADHVL